MTETTPSPLGNVITIDDERIKSHLDRVVRDCGANVGLTSLYFAAGYPKALIYIIEADPGNFSLLEKNTASEPRIRPIHACVVGARQPIVTFSNEGPAWPPTHCPERYGRTCTNIGRTARKVCNLPHRATQVGHRRGRTRSARTGPLLGCSRSHRGGAALWLWV